MLSPNRPPLLSPLWEDNDRSGGQITRLLDNSLNAMYFQYIFSAIGNLIFNFTLDDFVLGMV